MAKRERTCTCPASVYGGFKQGVGLGLGLFLVAGVPFLLLGAFALPAYLGSLARGAVAQTQTPTVKGIPVIDADLMPN